MPTVKGTCAVCGVAVERQVAGVFADAALAAPLCPTCADEQVLSNGGALLTLREEVPGSLFPLAKITVTPGAVALLAATGQHAWEFLLRHARGDWGEYGRFEEIALTQDEAERGWEATDESGKINKSNVLNSRDRVMSAYRTAVGQELWVITESARSGGTTVLLPEEY